jgi:hypothetical protein
MYFTKILLSIVFVLFASTALAAKPDKTLICHVDSDAGRIDLILVSRKSKHGDSHTFDGISDYAPLLADVGDDPADFEDNSSPPDGIDDGCETEELLTCPCWDTHTLSSLVAIFDDAELNGTPQCGGSSEASYVYGGGTNTWPGIETFWEEDWGGYCVTYLEQGAGQTSGFQYEDATTGEACIAEGALVVEQVDWCP